MDFSFTPEQEALRKVCDEFFDEVMKDAPEGWHGLFEEGYITKEAHDFDRFVARKMGQRGWLSLTWPKEYGGREASSVDQLIVHESRIMHGAPGFDALGVGMFAPTLIKCGNKEQKTKILPLIGKGEVTVCQLWSEPNAGSDLASLTTHTKEDGDNFIVNGQKTWTSGGHLADMGHLIARTDQKLPRHRGLSYFIVEDMKAPGITIKPVLNMERRHLWNEVYFDDFRIPKRNLLGEKNQGWNVVLTLMDFERSTLAWGIEARRHFNDLLDFCKAGVNSEALAKNPLVRHRLAEMAIELEVGRTAAYQLAAMADKGAVPPQEASASKIFNTSLYTRIAELGMSVLKHYGQIAPGSKWAPLLGKFETMYQSNFAWQLAGGSEEVQKNVIATRGLGLPRTW